MPQPLGLPRHYQRIEAGRSVTLQTLWKLARAFGVSPRQIIPAASPRQRERSGK